MPSLACRFTFSQNSERKINTQTLDFFPWIDMTGHEPPDPMDEAGQNGIPNNAAVCY